MLKERARTIAATVLILDLTLVAVAFALAHAIRQRVLPASGLVSERFYSLSEYLPLLPLAILLWALFLLSSGSYRSHRTISILKEARDLARTAVLSGLTFSFAIFFFRIDQQLLDSDNVSRSWIFLFVGLTFLLQFAEKLGLRLTARHLRARGYNFRNVLIVGTGPLSGAIADSIASHRFWGIRVLGMIGDASPDSPTSIPLLGQSSDLARIVEREAVDEVVLTVDYLEHPELEAELLRVQELGVLIRFAFDPFPNANGKLRLSEIDGIPLVTWSPTPGTPIQMVLKRATDVVVSGTLLVLLSPLLLLAAAAIKLTSSGQVLFHQRRTGLNGRLFTLYKFRTMIDNAERQREQMEALNEMSGPVFKVRKDPRVTPVGRFLRRYSFDELPQLWNVFKGDMSLVGPRPALLTEVEKYDRWQKRRLSMRPGLTCLWQVGGRNDVDFERWMELDLDYIDNWSPWLDMKILLKTIPVVLSGKAY